MRKSHLSKSNVKRSPRGRNQFTKAALDRAFTAARKHKIDQVEVEIPGGSKIIFKGIASKQAEEKTEHNEWDEELYGKNPPPVR
jgi:hypothetical protein